MKKLIITPLLMFLASVLMSAYASDIVIAGFEDGETGYKLNDGWAAYYEWEVANNSDNSGINTSNKCIMSTATTKPDSWGAWFIITLDEPILITAENRYLKVMVKRTPNTQNIGVACEGDGIRNTDPRAYVGRAKPSREGVWEDLVFDLFNNGGDLTWENQEIKHIFINHFGTFGDTEAGVCFLDNIVLSDNSKPRGTKEVNPGLLVNFEDENLTNSNFVGFNTQSPDAKCEIKDNPVKAGVNETAKCLEYIKPANTTWWHSAMAIVNGIIPVEYPNSYLHVMAYIPDGSPFVMIVSSPSGKQVQETMYPDDGEGWYDYVLDVSELDYINGINFRFNYSGTDEDWANEEGKYYIDDFALIEDMDPRTKPTLPTGIQENTNFETLKIYVDNGVASVSSPDLKVASVYSVGGQLISQKQSVGEAINFPLEKGVYIVKAANSAGKVSVQKLVVQ